MSQTQNHLKFFDSGPTCYLMKRRPWPLIILAGIHLLTPIGNILVNSFLMKVSPISYAKALLHPNNIWHAVVFFGVPVAAAALIYACRKWAYWTYIGLMSVPFIYSFVSWTESPNLATGIALVCFYLINIAIVGYFVLPGVRVVYFNPALRWWETKPRYTTDFQAKIFLGEDNHSGQVKNISQGGLFIEGDFKVPLNENLRVQFQFAEQEYIAGGKAVYYRSMNPAGYGLRFDLDLAGEDQIANLIARLKVEGVLHSSHVPGPEESFSHWLKNIFKSKQAWIPAAGQRSQKAG